MMEVVMTTGVKIVQSPVKSSATTNQYPVFTGWMLCLHVPNQLCQSTEGNKQEITITQKKFKNLTSFIVLSNM